jgi:DNA excision repair protein ERCC-4
MDKRRNESMQKKNLHINIVADDRECKGDVIKFLSENENVDLSIQRLSMGDYQIDNRMIVERKTLKDFAVSIIDGRLFKQMIRLEKSNYRSVLVLEGTVSDTAEIGVTREAMQGALITVSIILGTPVLRSKDPSETARLMVYIGRQIDSLARGGLHRHGYRPKGKRRTQLFILQGLPGIGSEKADRLLNRFGSVEAAISASSSNLQSVDGIGKSIADKIRWAVSERVTPYRSRPFSSTHGLTKAVTPNPDKPELNIDE